MPKKIFNRQTLPWFIVAGLAIVLIAVLFAKGPAKEDSNVINGVVQDNSGRRVLYWADPMFAQGPPHNYTSNKPGIAPDCQMKLVPVYADEGGTAGPAASSVSGYSKVSLPAGRQQLIGVKLAKAQERDLSRTVRTVGTIAADETRRAQITLKFEGYIERLYVDYTGQTVRRGQPLLSVYSPDLFATQNELLLAARNRQQFGGALYEAARRRLLLWDVSPADIDRIERTGEILRSITLRSPVDGVVLTKNAVAGTQVMPGMVLYELADLRRVWVLADVYDAELPYTRVGQPAQVTLTHFPGRTWIGRISFVPPVVDPKTRTAKVRIELDNPDGVLKPETFADVILQQPVGYVLAVPDTAVLQTGTRSIVFVSQGEGRFEPREVQTGAKTQGFYEIRRGLAPGETVVVDANFLVDSDSRLKAAMAKMQ